MLRWWLADVKISMDSSAVQTHSENATKTTRTIRVIEWFSGIGGWSFALKMIESKNPAVSFDIVKAVDINTVANEVYEQNLHLKPLAKSIESLTDAFFDMNPADMWVMSPPCQPFTRNHERAANDNRTQALDHIITVIRRAASACRNNCLPAYICLENVVGFENSVNCLEFLSTISDAGYNYQQFFLSPVQFGIPNERPRYFLLAAKQDNVGPALPERSPSKIYTSLPAAEPYESRRLGDYLCYELTDSELDELYLSNALLSKQASWCMDLVDENSVISACFTKAYSRYMKGSGSVLVVRAGSAAAASSLSDTGSISGGKRTFEIYSDDVPLQQISHSYLSDPAIRTFDANWKTIFPDAKFRYLSPKELLKLFGFPDSFVFPARLTNRKCYELIGNSVNVTVVAQLVEYLLFAFAPV